MCRARRGLIFQSRGELLPRIDKPVHLKLILAVVKLPVPSAPRKKFLVRSPLDDFTRLENQDLIGAPDGREAVGDDECRPSLAQMGQSFLDHRLAFAVETGGGL